MAIQFATADETATRQAPHRLTLTPPEERASAPSSIK